MTTRNWNDSLSAYNLRAGNMARWIKAYAQQRAGTKQAQILWVGDSTTHGFGGTAPFSTNSAAGRFKAYLDSIPGNQDVGWGLVPTFDAGNSSGDTRVTAVGASPGAAGYVNIGASPSTNTMTLNIPAGTVIDTVDIYFAGSFGATSVPITVDGGTAVNAPSTATPISTYTATVTAGAAHTITVGAGNGGSAWMIGGFRARKNVTTGVLVHRVGFSGASVDNATSQPSGLPVQQFFRDTLAPDLVIIKSGINGGTAAAAKATTAGSIASWQGGGSSVALLAPNPISYANDWMTGKDYMRMVDSYYDLAEKYDVPLLDTRKRWNLDYIKGTSALDVSIHPTVLGYQDEAEYVAHALVDNLIR